MKILNTINEDYHMHSINYSDGMNTIDEIVQYAGKIGLKKITITDHSQFMLDSYGIINRNRRVHTERWKNIHNDVEVNFGIEWDLMDEEGNCSFDIQGHTSDFCILSCHAEDYTGELKNITQAYIKAIHKYHDKIKCMGHLCNKKTSEYLDIEAVVDVLNQYQIPIEINCFYLHIGLTDLEKLDRALSLIQGGVYINSDMHALNDFSLRQAGFDYLKEKGYR